MACKRYGPNTKLVFTRNGVTGYLQHVPKEQVSSRRHGKAYFSYPLAFLDRHRRWLLSGDWRGNAWRQAQRTLESLGWKLEDEIL